jgi:hypothetical protein
MNAEDAFSQNIQRARVSYDRAATYHQSLFSHPLYEIVPHLFDQPVNAWDLADGTGFIQAISRPELRIDNVVFIDWGHRDNYGAANIAKVSAYFFDSQRNSVRFLDLAGNVHEIPVTQYGLTGPSDIQEGDAIRMRIAAGDTGDISVEFSLRAHHEETPEGMPPYVDTDHIEVVTQSEGSLSKKKGERAMNRHADFYINLLLLLDPETDRERLYVEMGQIDRAVQHLQNEEVGSIFHPGLVQAKLRAVSGGFVERFLGKLLQHDINHPEEITQAGVAIQLVESGFADYSVRVDVLKQLLQEAREKLA